MLTIAEKEAQKLKRRKEIKSKYEWDGAGLTLRKPSTGNSANGPTDNCKTTKDGEVK